jgi:putative endopeptidase
MRHAHRLAATSLPLLLAALASLAACGGAAQSASIAQPTQPTSATPPAATTPNVVPTVTPGDVAVDLAALDRSVAPCQDFYQFACGTWLKATPIPDDQSIWGRGLSVLREQNETRLMETLEKAAASPGSGPYEKALGDFYASCMDEKAIEKQGAAPLKAELKKIALVTDKASLAKVVARLHTMGAGVLFSYDSQQDFQDATQVIASVSQDGLGLPERDYYLDDSAKMKELRTTYEGHIERMLALAGDSPADAKKAREAVMRIETQMATAQMSKVDRRDPKKIYHRMDLAGVKQAAPTFPWDVYVKEVGATGTGVVNLAQPDYVKVMGEMLTSVPMADWKAYLKWHAVRLAAPRLNAAFENEAFAFTKALTGAAKLPPRWKRCVRAVDRAMGEALGRPFVAAVLGEEGKATTKTMIQKVEDAMKADLETLAWMDPATRGRANDKLGHIENKVGYPDKWREYDALKIDRTSYLGNVLRGAEFESKRELAKIGKPLDRGEWHMTPPTVNAYYSASMNEMVFPAGILQSPFYSAKATSPANFGGIGMVMGHELTHGFDDQGRKFDGAGNLKDWWTDTVGAEFDRRAKCVADQFEAYKPLPDVHLNGKLTLGENIADLGGIKLAFRAMQKAQGDGGPTQKDGFSAEQQFFLGFAQSWCSNVREETARMRAVTDPHAPPQFRVIGPLSNLPEFAKAFQCKEGDPMVRPAAQRCEIW